MGVCFKVSICLFLASYLLSLSSASKLEDAFRRNNIVPQVLKKSPHSIAKVEYSAEVTANLGNTLNQEDTEHIPYVTWDADPTAYYTLIMIDLDEKSAVIPGGTFLHWLVANILGNQVTSGDTHADYLHPNPSQTESHRYVQLVYKQSRMKLGAFFIENDSRIHFSLDSYVKHHNLIGPIAGNFYKVL
nr:phosphatidylethanolamine-binding protein-like protein [Yponomeuta evonymella]